MKYDINLIPKKQKGSIKDIAFALILVLIAFVGLFIFAFMLPTKTKLDLRKEVVKLEEEITSLDHVEFEYNEVSSEEQMVSSELNIYDNLKIYNLRTSVVLSALESIMTDNLIINEFNYNGGSISLAGESPNYKEISEFLVNMRDLDFLDASSFHSASLLIPAEEVATAVDMYEFNLTVNTNEFNLDFLLDIVEEAEEVPEENTNEGEGEDNEAK